MRHYRGESEALIPLIMQTLSAGPLSRPAIAAAIRPKASKQVRFWMENSWSLVRLPVAGGLICYGRGEGSEIVFIRTDHWLPKLKRSGCLRRKRSALSSENICAPTAQPRWPTSPTGRASPCKK